MTRWCYGLKCSAGDTDDTTMYHDTKSSDAGSIYASILFNGQKVDVLADKL